MLAGLASAFWLGGLRVNVTPSYALGLWRIVPLDRDVTVGDRVFICPPETPEFREARARGYLRSGLCPSWLSPLIKTVVAVSGQRVEIGDAVVINGVPLGHSGLRQSDAEGRSLSAFEGGTVPFGHVFLHSDYSGSYDSRYFGPIPADGIHGLAQPLITVDP